jgi:hypothetical protein
LRSDGQKLFSRCPDASSGATLVTVLRPWRAPHSPSAGPSRPYAGLGPFPVERFNSRPASSIVSVRPSRFAGHECASDAWPPSHTCCDHRATGSRRIPLAEQQGSRWTIGEGRVGSIGVYDVRPTHCSRALSKRRAEFSEIAKTAETPFICDYYSRLAQRYLMHAKNQEKLARISEGFAADRHQDDQIADSPHVRAAAGHFGRGVGPVTNVGREHRTG